MPVSGYVQAYRTLNREPFLRRFRFVQAQYIHVIFYHENTTLFSSIGDSCGYSDPAMPVWNQIFSINDSGKTDL